MSFHNQAQICCYSAIIIVIIVITIFVSLCVCVFGWIEKKKYQRPPNQ